MGTPWRGASGPERIARRGRHGDYGCDIEWASRRILAEDERETLARGIAVCYRWRMVDVNAARARLTAVYAEVGSSIIADYIGGVVPDDVLRVIHANVGAYLIVRPDSDIIALSQFDDAEIRQMARDLLEVPFRKAAAALSRTQAATP